MVRRELWCGPLPLLEAAARRAAQTAPFLRLQADEAGRVELPLLPPHRLVLLLPAGGRLPSPLPEVSERLVLLRPGPRPGSQRPGLLVREFSSATAPALARMVSWFAPSSPPLPPELAEELAGSGPELVARFLLLLPFLPAEEAFVLAGPPPLPAPHLLPAVLSASSPSRLQQLSARVPSQALTPLVLSCLRRSLLLPSAAAQVVRLARSSSSAALVLLAAHLLPGSSSETASAPPPS